jgi:hypothetical protein
MISTEQIADKARPIRELVGRVMDLPSGRRFSLVDDWQGDRYAIGLSGPQADALVYVSAWGQPAGAYSWSFEHPIGRTLEEGSATLDALVDVLVGHLLAGDAVA